MLDKNMRVRFANRAAGAIFGFARSRLRGAHLIAAIPSIELERRAANTLEGDVTPGPLIVAGKSVNRSYAVSVYPLTDSGDRITGALILAEDQTELLALERARQEFLSNVSHELRTPLSSVKLMLETVTASGDEDARGVFVPQALREVDRLASLVQRLLEQARAESGEVVLQVAEVDLEAVARPIVQSFEQQAAAQGVSLELRALRPIVIEADAERLSQVFVNLVDNALRFTQQGGSVLIELDAAGGYAIVRANDTGIGIPHKDLPFIFERFYVVDRSRARGISGAGLGLAIVKQIVEAHGGEVTVESTLGSGARFTVKIPLVAVPPEA